MPLGAPTKQPEGFLTVSQALQKPNYSSVNIIGIVNDVMPITASRGTDLQFTINIQDTSVTAKLGQGPSIRVKFFVAHESEAPQPVNVGDAVLLRDFKVSMPVVAQTSSLLWRKNGSECLVFPSNGMPDPHFHDSYASGRMLPYISRPQSSRLPTPEQQMWAISLRHSLPSGQIARVQPVINRPAREPGRKFSLIKDIGPHQFFDLVVEVVKLFPAGQEIYVTDYTENNLLFRYPHPDENLDVEMGRDGDEYGYTASMSAKKRQGPPYGKMILQVKLWEPHASIASNKVKEGDVIELKNVHIKMDPAGTKLEGTLHQDRDYPDKLGIHWNLLSARTYEIKDRRQDYLARLNKQEQRGSVKQKRKEKRRRDRKGKPATAPLEDHAGGYDGQLNSHVKCERPQDPTTCLADIESNDKRFYRTPDGVDRELPFVNATYRARVRVVDFFPQNLEDFSNSLEDRGYNDVNADGETQSTTSYSALSTGTQRWEWRFLMLVEDAKRPGTKDPVRIPLLVYDKDAEYLLRLDAANLRNDKKTLSELREKLFILWGNLEELKAAGKDPLDNEVAKTHSSNSFDCCIKEVGIKVDDEHESEGKAELGYQRVYYLCGTTIND